MIFIIVALAFAYLVVGGVVGRVTYVRRTALCGCAKSERYCSRDHGSAAGLAGAFWPFSIPMFLGMALGEPRASRAERQRAVELAEANHRAEIAEAKAREEAATERRYRTLMAGACQHESLDTGVVGAVCDDCGFQVAEKPRRLGDLPAPWRRIR